MLADKIVGRVGADILRARIEVAAPTDGGPGSLALFRLDKLGASQIAAVVREILASPDLSARVDIRIPETLVRGTNLPPEVLTVQNAGAVRNEGTDREVLLTANGNEPNLADTLGHVTALGAREFRGREDAWADATCHVTGLSPTQEDRRVFRAALRGLLAASDLSLHQIGDYCSMVSEASRAHGHPIRDAMGWAMPWVGLPRDTSLFSSDKKYGASSGSWKKTFEKLFAERAPLLDKLRKNGQPLDLDELRERLEANADAMADNVRETVAAFIVATPGDGEAARELALLEWEKDRVHLVFDRPKEKEHGLAQSTLNFFDNDCEDPDVLTENARKYLEDLKTRERRSEWNEDEEEDFYEGHRRYMEQDPRLHARWEKVVFGKPIECVDFLDGMVTAVQRLTARAGEAKGERFLRMTVSKGRKEWRERFNHDAGAFFSTMWRGLPELLGERVEWRVERMGSANLPDPLFDYPAFFARETELRNGKLKPSQSSAKAQTQIKFEATLIARDGEEQKVLEKTQMLWLARPEAIGMTVLDDMKRLREKGGVACTEVPRRLVSKKGGVQSASLLDVNTLEATYSRDSGSLVPPPARLKSLRAEIKRRLDELREDRRITDEQRDEIRAAWDSFEAAYGAALDDFIGRGLHTDAVMAQAEAFGTLLRTLKVHARGDVCRARLVSEVLSVGTVRLTGGQPSVIIPPWHPERMKALAVKTRRVAGLIAHMLGGKGVSFGDRNIFFREFSDELAHPFYPEIAVVSRGGTPVLVTETDTVNGYSLLERPVRSDDGNLTDVNPAEAAKQVRDLLERYVGLQPHEASNLSVLLYNADAASLPLAVVRELAGMRTDGGLQCNVSIRHQDPGKLRRVYADLVGKSGSDPDVPVVSEISENFMSKLRISVSPQDATPPKAADGFRPFDVAFLHDVVSRTASEEWVAVDWINDRPDLDHAPSRWTYRSVSGENELKSTTFLTCPQQTFSGRSYVDMVGAVVRQEDAPSGHHLVPARRISLQNENLKAILDDAHDLAEWVATFDELLDKRQLQANKITVVRYRRRATNGRNMIVSSTSELRLLGVLTRRRLRELGLSLDEVETDSCVARLKNDAVSVSGDIVLRAAKRGVSAGEMMGLVFSRYLVEREFRALAGDGARSFFTVFFLLDDYADWLAQRENRIADLLGLCVEEGEDGLRLHVAVVESKYVSVEGAAEARRSSKAQLMATLSTFREALFGDPGRLDRDLWLSRVADLLVDADIPPGHTALLERARSAIRDGMIGITLRGYSQVFVHTAEPGAGGTGSERLLLDSTDGVPAHQEVFARQDLRRLAEAYARGGDSRPVRDDVGGGAPWPCNPPRPPAPRVSWTGMVESLSPSAATAPETAVAAPAVSPAQAAEAVPAVPDLAPAQPVTVPGISFMPAEAGEGSSFARVLDAKVAALAGGTDAREEWAADVSRRLKTALNGYGMQAQILGTRLTPNGCLVRLAGSDKLRVEDVEGKRLQLLTTHSIILVTVQPKPGEIIVSIAGDERRAVSLWEVWGRRRMNRNAAGINTSFVLGVQEINGNILYLNLGGEFGGLSSHEPHSLVAGSTGSGKSVLIQALLLDIAATNPKNLANIILIDPKMGVDYAALDTLPHLREPIVTTKERASQVLASLVEEMEGRYRIFAAARARDLASYNAKCDPSERLPMLFLVHDEFADWMLDDEYKAAVGAAVQRLGVKARAAGIHLFFAAQRPDKDVMPMQLRENLGNRLILKVASEATSKIALDRPGAELLLGKGHLAAKLNGEQGLIYAQAPFLSDEDIAAAVDAILVDDRALG